MRPPYSTVLIACALITAPLASTAQTAAPADTKRAFLDRYLSCAEAPGDAARLACYDQLLLDIPAWIDNVDDPSQATRPTQVNGANYGAFFKIENLQDTSSH